MEDFCILKSDDLFENPSDSIDFINQVMEEDDEPYKVIESAEGATTYIKSTSLKNSDPEETTLEKKLINAAIVPKSQIISKHLGGLTQRQLKLSGIHNNKILDTITISIKDLMSEKWLYEHWGTSIRLFSTDVKNAYVHLRQYIQTVSKYIPTDHIYNYNGWLEDEDWVYMHGRGTIGKNIDHEIIAADSITKYSIKTSDISEEKACLFVLDTMMNIAEKHISWSTLAFTFLSLITSKLQKAGIKPEYVLYIEGVSGTRKTSLSKKVFNIHENLLDNVPIHFDMCTQPAMEIMGMSLRDCVCLYDDIPPAKDEVTKRNQEKKMEALVRTYGESIGRQKMGSQNKKLEMKPGGLAAVTAESLILRNASSISRILRIKVNKNSINLEKLTKAQNKKYHMPTAVKYYIKYISEEGDSFIENFIQDFHKNRELLKNKVPNVHGRLIQAAAWQLTSLITYLNYAKLKLLSKFQKNDVDKITKEYIEILVQLIKDQQQLISQDNEVNLFVKAVKELLATNKIRLLRVTTNGKKKEIKEDYKEKDVAGFKDNEYIYFFQDTIYGMVCSYYNRQNRSFPVDQSSLLDALKEKKLLKPDNNQDCTKTVRLTVNGHRIRVIRLDKDKFETWDDNGTYDKFFNQINKDYGGDE